ncbi:hypothetical protein ARMGADRAFT_287789 [Armillaria gallica]|uniref:Uncharacterized protein n=1 Tax=Armillaria gallica TaxID=47427 RepID=A0A2H3DUK4_ARMGA|nr:hypothetical protein ARMGADRAFT_287789 [Armillaria gallica]
MNPAAAPYSILSPGIITATKYFTEAEAFGNLRRKGYSGSGPRHREVAEGMGLYETLCSTNLLCGCDHTICFVSYQLPSIQALLLSSPTSLCRRSIFQCLPPTSSPTVFWSVLSGSIYLTTSAYSCSFDGPPPKSQVQIHRQRRLLFSFIWEKTHPKLHGGKWSTEPEFTSQPG